MLGSLKAPITLGTAWVSEKAVVRMVVQRGQPFAPSSGGM